MAPARKPKLTARTVVTLAPEEKKALQRRAREERVSASEVLRRSFRAYTSDEAKADEAAIKFLLAQVNEALDQALESSRNSRVEIEKNLAFIREREEQRMQAYSAHTQPDGAA